MSKEITAYEAVYGFAVWLTGCEGTMKIGACHDSGDICEKANRFCEENGLVEPRRDWGENVEFPEIKGKNGINISKKEESDGRISV